MALGPEREQLVQVERQIAGAKERIAWHKKNIEKLTRNGRASDLATTMLGGWERTLVGFEQQRNRILEQLQDAE